MNKDIAKCANGDCPSKDKCYRYTSVPDEYQVYSNFEPDGDKCDDFITNE